MMEDEGILAILGTPIICFTSALLYVTAPDILNERNRAVLRQFGIGEAKWIFIRNPEDPVSVEYDPLVHKLGVEYL